MAGKAKSKAHDALAKEGAELRLRLQEAEDTLRAIRSGDIDALLVAGESGDQVFTLKGAEHGYRLFVEGMHEGAVTLRADGLILHCNARFAGLIETPLDQVIGVDFTSFIREEQSKEIQAFLHASGDRRQEFALKSSRGNFLPVLLAISAALVEKSSGAMCMIVTDIREQKNLEQLQQTKLALEQSQDQLKLALETARLGSWKYDLASGAIETSAQCRANLGLPPDAPLTRERIMEIIHPDDRARIEKNIGQSLKDNLSYDSECRIYHPDGSLHWILVSGRVLLNDVGVATHMVGVMLDNTIRKLAEESLQESERRFRTLTEAIPQLSWTCQPDGNCDYLSQQWVDYTGVPLKEQLGRNWLRVLHPDDREKTMAAWNTAVETGGEYDLEFRIKGRTGTYRWFKTRGAPVRDDRRKIVRWFGTCTDLEDIVQARHILSRDKEQLEELVRSRTASLNEATAQLNEFCYTIAHDLRAPLRAQQGYARIILEDHGDKIGENGKQFAQRIVNAAEKLENLVHDLLSHVSISREDLPLARVDLAEVVAQVRADLGDAILRRGAQVELGSLEGVVLGHEPSLNLIVTNLVSNALKYTKAGDKPRIKIWTDPSHALVRLWVEDHGIGIAPEYHEKIFGVFQRLHATDAYPGTGIGLALVRKGIERMGGKAGVISKPGEGSQFWIELPAFELPGPI